MPVAHSVLRPTAAEERKVKTGRGRTAGGGIVCIIGALDRMADANATPVMHERMSELMTEWGPVKSSKSKLASHRETEYLNN